MLEQPINFLRDLYRSRSLLKTMTISDLKNRYLGSVLGVIWAFLQPLVSILVVWFVFQVGFKSKPLDQGVPFSFWLITAMVPWLFIAEAIQSSTTSILEQANVVKKVVFRVSLLPLVKISSALIIHLFFLLFMIGLAVFYGYYPGLMWFQLLYYLLASVFLILGVSWLTSSVIVFFRDLGQFVAVVIQIGFWATPIFWELKFLPEAYQIFFKLNPFYYITDGYRSTFCGGLPFWERPLLTLYFWGVSSLCFFAGMFVFRKLKPHFADVL